MTTTNPLDALLFVRDGSAASRWNFPTAVGTPPADPGGLGIAVNLTYSFLDAVPGYAANDYVEPITGFQTCNANLRQATASVLASIQEIIGVSFLPASSGLGQITFGLSTQPLGQSGYAYAPGYQYSYSSAPDTILSVAENAAAGDVWINANTNWIATDWLAGGSGYATLLHEIGHALGLKHPFEATASGFTLDSALDNESHTVMSYNQAPQSTVLSVSGTPSSFSWQTSSVQPSTLMPLDIEALQYLYGPNTNTNTNTSTRTGNDIYQWANNAELLQTIWDASGSDTIDCANQTLTCLIDLTPGNFSSIGLRQTDAELRLGLDLPSWFTEPLPADIYNGSNNLAIAKGVLIESAIGGSGNDVITGNAAANVLIGSAGNDTLIGGDGFDTAIFSGPMSSYVISGEVAAFTVAGSDGTDSLAGIEQLRFTDGDIIVRPNSAPTFAVGTGTLITDFGLADMAYGSAMQADGKFLLAGSSGSDFAVARYNPDGSLDTSFSEDGKLTSSFSTGSTTDIATCMAVQSDGKIIAGGVSNNNFALARYNPDGSLDTSFDADGLVSTDLGGGDWGQGLTLQPDGKILLAGYGGASTAFALVRYNADGSLDTSFDGDGKVSTDFGARSQGWCTLLQEDGKILVAGTAGTAVDFALARYNTDGSLDATFGINGKLTTDFGSVDVVNSLALQSDGRILAAGYSANNFALARYNPDGSLDTSLNGSGTLTTNIDQNDRAEAVVIQPDGRIVLAGSSNSNFSLIRYNSDGSLDTAFNAGGKVITDFGLTDEGRTIMLLPDGGIVVAGGSGGGNSTNFALARYLPDARLDLGFGAVNTLDATPTYGGTTAVVLDANVQIFDAELSTLDNYAGSTLTLARHASVNAFDEFSAPAGGALSTLTTGANLQIGALSVGQVVSNSAGYLQLSFNGNSTAALVSQVMQQIAYANTDSAPAALVQIDWTLSDGNMGAQGLGGAMAAVSHSLVNIAGGLQTLNVLAYHWKTHTLLDGVTVADSSQTVATDTSGACSISVAPVSSLGLTTVRDVPVAQEAGVDAAVNLQDAIAILKMIVGLEVNGTGQPLSPYQALSADFDGNGAVGLTDAIGVLKHVVGLSAPPPTWQFAHEASSAVAGISAQTLTTLPTTAISIDTANAISPIHVGLVGYLRGDVDASYAESAGSQNLDVLQPTYLADMTAAHGLSMTQFGVYGV